MSARLDDAEQDAERQEFDDWLRESERAASFWGGVCVGALAQAVLTVLAVVIL